MTASEPTRRCIYCGAPATSDDHVPPRGLIRPCRRQELWTVDSCDICNGGASSDEEYFRLMVVGGLCHTREADELFDGPISRSMDKRPSKESWLFGSLGVQGGNPYIEWNPASLERVATKIVRGLAHRLDVPAAEDLVFGLHEAEGRGDFDQWAPDFSFSRRGHYWELWFFDSVCVSARPSRR